MSHYTVAIIGKRAKRVPIKGLRTTLMSMVATTLTVRSTSLGTDRLIVCSLCY